MSKGALNARLSRRGLLAVAATGCLLVLLMVQYVGVPGRSILAQSAQDALHGPFFALLTVLLAIWTRLWFEQKSLVFVVAIVSSLALLMALATESSQHLTGRSASFRDVLADIAGIVSGMVIWLGALWRKQKQCTRPLLFTVCLVCAAAIPVLVAAAPLWSNLYGLVQRHQQGSVLFDARIGWFGYLRNSAGVSVRLDNEGAQLRDATPGWFFELAEITPDWREADQLCLRIRNDREEPLATRFRVHDWPHNHEYSDRFGTVLWWPVGFSTQCIDVAAITGAPRTRTMDPTQMVSIRMFPGFDRPGALLTVQRVWLTVKKLEVR